MRIGVITIWIGMPRVLVDGLDRGVRTPELEQVPRSATLPDHNNTSKTNVALWWYKWNWCNPSWSQ